MMLRSLRQDLEVELGVRPLHQPGRSFSNALKGGLTCEDLHLAPER